MHLLMVFLKLSKSFLLVQPLNLEGLSCYIVATFDVGLYHAATASCSCFVYPKVCSVVVVVNPPKIVLIHCYVIALN